MSRGVARPGQVKTRLGSSYEAELEELLRSNSLTALANRWHVATQTIEGVRFGGSAMAATIEKLRGLIDRERGKAA